MKRYLAYSIPGIIGVLLFWGALFSPTFMDRYFLQLPALDPLWSFWAMMRIVGMIVVGTIVHTAALTPLSMGAHKNDYL